MKTCIFNRSTKLLISASVLMLLGSHFLFAQTKDVNQYLQGLPNDLELIENGPHKFRITTDYFNGDIYGNFMNKTRVTGEYNRGLVGGTVKWNNVQIANGSTREGAFDAPQALDYMEGFTYVPSPKMVEPSAFPGFPQNSFHAKNLVWDMLGIEMFAWQYFDTLKLNQLFRAKDSNGAVQLAGQGSFENRDIQLKWIGISKMGQEICALIEYRTMDNPLAIVTDQIKIKGRSHYWGTVYVSLEDKQIEYAELYEDVIMDTKIGDQPSNLVDATRKIVFEKVN